MVGELALCDYVSIYQASSQSLSLLSCTSWREWGCLPELEGLAEVVDVSHVRYSAQGERQLETVLSMRGGGGGVGLTLLQLCTEPFPHSLAQLLESPDSGVHGLSIF